MYGWLSVFIFSLSITFSGQLQAAVRTERIMVDDPQGKPLEIGVWSPEGDASKLPLVVVSHGTGGDFRSHHDTAQALAENGFIVAAVTHTGDNWRDLSGTAKIWERPRHLKVLTDYMLSQWTGSSRIDPGRIGAFGFSAGGFSVLVAAGGVPDLRRVQSHCGAHPDFFECLLLTSAPQGGELPKIEWTADPRIKAVVVAAPALGYTFGTRGLASLKLPMQLWSASLDEILPSPFYADAVREALPVKPDFRVVQKAGHFDFLSPCSADALKHRPEICLSAEGFSRAAFHNDFNAQLVAFFSKQLPPSPAK